MKKIILLLVVLITTQSYGSHLMGGQVTSRNLGGLTYETTLTIYRDTLGVPINPTDVFLYRDLTGTFSLDESVNAQPRIIMPNGVEKYIYIDTITYPSPGQYIIIFATCCRNGAIINLNNPGGVSMFLQDSLWVDPTNSSPIFLNDPITVGQVGVPFTYNPLPFDSDGDSLVWIMDTPMDFNYLGILGTPIPGFFLPPSDTSMPFTLNSTTGEISFLPTVIGTYALSIKAIEYRNGVEIGNIRRDMQLIIGNSSNIPPIVSTNVQILRTSTNINVGQTFNFNISATDPDNQSIDITVNGDLLFTQIPPIINSVSTAINNISTNIDWTPSSADIRIQPYTFCCRVSEQFGPITFYHDYSYSLKVSNITSTNEIEKINMNVYPNPANNLISLNYDKQQDATLSLINTSGQKVLSQLIINGINNIDVSNIAQGVYYVTIDGSFITTVVITK